MFHSFVMSKGLSDREALVFTKNLKHIDLLNECVNAHVFDYVKDWRLFARNMGSVDPYKKEEYGECPSELFGARQRLLIALKIEAPDTNKLYDLAVWSVFNVNNTLTYMTSNKLLYFCMKWGLNKLEFFKHLFKLPTSTNLFTSYDIRNNEIAIQDLLSRACCLGIAPKESPTLDTVQNASLRGIMTRPYSALKGGAGVGKTVCVSEAIKQMLPFTTVMAISLTNKAKRCIQARMEQNGIVGDNVIVSTIHSLIMHLKTRPYVSAFVIVDEASMVDIDVLGELARGVMKCVDRFQLCFVGDDFQLSPVGRGEFFRQLVTSRPNSTFALSKCYRANDVELFDAFEMLRNGFMPPDTATFQTVLCANDKELNSKMGAFICQNTNKFQYVAWQNRDVFKLNKWVQDNLLKSGAIGPIEWKGYHERDVICYRGSKTDSGLTNALTGQVACVRKDGMDVTWENGDKTSFKTDCADVQLFYTGTVHLMQGSEYPNVAVACYDVKKMTDLLDRRWLYTACTRAKCKVVLFATCDIHAFLKKDVTAIPVSGLVIQV